MTAPQLELLIDGKSKIVYAFQDASLQELRFIASLNSNYTFYYEGLAI
jgi:hypothetical protein